MAGRGSGRPEAGDDEEEDAAVFVRGTGFADRVEVEGACHATMPAGLSRGFGREDVVVEGRCGADAGEAGSKKPESQQQATMRKRTRPSSY
jgi:hypothetical protein